MRLRRTSGYAVLLAILTGPACGSGNGTAPDADPVADAYEVVFTQSPLRMADLVGITPLGSLNPPDHTIPNDHIFFAYVDRCPCDFSPRPVFAPGSGTVRFVQRGQDDRLEIGAQPHVAGSELAPWYYMAHVILSADVQVGRQVTAGEQIGLTGSHAFAVDLGVVNPDAENFFVVRERYHTKALYGDKPLRYFTEPLRSQLYALVQRQGSDKDGKFDYDVAGRLTGGWFHESLPADSRSTGPEGWSRNLAFVFWEREPAVPLVAVGGTILPPLAYWIAADGPDFGSVSVASGAVAYRIHGARPLPPLPPSPDHILLVQLVSDTRLRVQIFPPATQAPAFTAQSMTYLR